MENIIERSVRRVVAYLEGQIPGQQENLEAMMKRLARDFSGDGPGYEDATDLTRWRDRKATLEVYKQAHEILTCKNALDNMKLIIQSFDSDMEHAQRSYKSACEGLAKEFSRGGPMGQSSDEAQWITARAKARAYESILEKLIDAREAVL